MYNEEMMEKYVTHPKCIAIGECGLDYFRLPEERKKKNLQTIKKQREVFIAQIEFRQKK